MEIRVEVKKGQDDPTYTVRIGDDVYEMNDRATAPNGVCLYIGCYADGMRFDSSPHAPLVKPNVDALPVVDAPPAVVQKIADIVAERVRGAITSPTA